MLGTYGTRFVSRKCIKTVCCTDELNSDECQGGTTMSGLVSDVDIRVSWPEIGWRQVLLIEQNYVSVEAFGG